MYFSCGKSVLKYFSVLKPQAVKSYAIFSSLIEHHGTHFLVKITYAGSTSKSRKRLSNNFDNYVWKKMRPNTMSTERLNLRLFNGD